LFLVAERRGRDLLETSPGTFLILFPQIAQQDGEEAIGRAPDFLDYLFVSFTTSATFGPTDTPVLSRRGKVLPVVQCMLSLVVVVVLVAWAVDAL
jgi:uncharacterized membrane protein